MKEYIRRHRDGWAAASSPPRGADALLSETHGVMIYQEDVMKVAHHIAGLSLSEADLLRRAMSGKSRSAQEMARLEEIFISSAVSRGVEEEAASELWRQIRSFAGYSFCKAHSASFALLSFQTAYLKTHYPEVFMAAVLSNRGGFYPTGAYIEEARRMGIEILPPDINRSGIAYRAGRGWIRVGLMEVRDLSRSTMERIVRERRRRGFYTSLAEFCYRTEAGEKETENLVLCGAFDSFELNRPELLWRLAETRRRGARGKKTSLEYFKFVRRHHALHSPRSLVPRVPDYTDEEKLKREAEVLGFTASSHPLSLCRGGGAETIEARDIRKHGDGEVELVGWLVCTKRVRTSRGDYMRFLTFEDTTDTFEAVIFPAAYMRCGHILDGPGPYLVRGTVSEERGAFTINVASLRPIVQAHAGEPL
jgi:DNA polymerase III alpha subunit